VGTDNSLESITVVYDSDLNLYSSGFMMNNLDDFTSVFIQANFQSGGNPYAWTHYLETKNIVGTPQVPAQESDYSSTFNRVAPGFTYRNAFNPISTGDFRADHPAGIDSGLTPISGLNSVTFTDNFSKNPSPPESSIAYQFDQTLDLGDDFIVATSMWCGNDVTISPTPVPEPGTLLMLISSGLLMGVYARRKRKLH
jgi:hypothetical protein